MVSGFSTRDRFVPGAPGCLPCLRPVLPRSDLGAGLPNLSEDGGIEEFPEFMPKRRLRAATSVLPRTSELRGLRCDQHGQLVVRRTNTFPHNKIIPQVHSQPGKGLNSYRRDAANMCSSPPSNMQTCEISRARVVSSGDANLHAVAQFQCSVGILGALGGGACSVAAEHFGERHPMMAMRSDSLPCSRCHTCDRVWRSR